MREEIFVLGILVKNRSDFAPEVQQIITEYGSDIIGRLGVPSQDKSNGLILLVIQGEAAARRLTGQLSDFKDFQVKTMQFCE